MAKNIRIVLLLFVFVLVAVNAFQTRTRTTEWDQSMWVTIYPVNGDGSVATGKYIAALQADVFSSLSEYFGDEAKRYGVELSDPLIINLAPEVSTLPPAAPIGGSVLSVVWWSLKLRYWALTNDTGKGPSPDARIFVVFFDPATHKELEHSVGIKEGMIAVVNAFAGRTLEARNNVIVLHELLHTFGATDKYDLATGRPLFPDGYAEPEAKPRYPQRWAEIMGGVVPVSEAEALMPESVWRTTVGGKTAIEIGWR